MKCSYFFWIWPIMGLITLKYNWFRSFSLKIMFPHKKISYLISENVDCFYASLTILSQPFFLFFRCYLFLWNIRCVPYLLIYSIKTPFFESGIKTLWMIFRIITFTLLFWEPFSSLNYLHMFKKWELPTVFHYRSHSQELLSSRSVYSLRLCIWND